MASFISYTILYAVLIISVFQRAFAQMSTLQTGCEGTTPNAQDTCPRNYFPHYDAVLTEKISNDLQYQISPDTQVIDLRGSLDWHVRSYKPIDLVHFLSTCTGPICAIKGDAGHIYSAYGLYSEYCYARRDQRYWNTTNEPTLTTVTDHTTQTPPPATSIINSLPLQTASSNEVPSTSTQDTATNPIPKSTSPDPTSTTLSNNTNSEQGSWTRTGGIISILGLVISSILGFIGVVYAIKTFYKR